jgi:hypothetical protein
MEQYSLSMPALSMNRKSAYSAGEPNEKNKNQAISGYEFSGVGGGDEGI